MPYEPPFELNNEILQLVADIAQRVGMVQVLGHLNVSPRLRKENRIRTIHSSLAIENNSLSLDQVTAVIEGKHVLAPPRDILEVQNALAAYEAIPTLRATSMDDLLRAHGMLMAGLTPHAGCFRSGNVGVFAGDRLVHAGTPAAYVPQAMADLFDWLRISGTHPLAASCVFHYEFEFIHPFADGNGRMGRLWQTLILSEWNPLFAWLPVESIVKDNQRAYYDALAQADGEADCTGFIVFMLDAIRSALREVAESEGNAASREKNDAIDGAGDVGGDIDVGNVGNRADEDVGNVGDKLGAPEAISKRVVLECLRKNAKASAASIASSSGFSKRQIERAMRELREAGRIERIGGTRGYWKLNG